MSDPITFESITPRLALPLLFTGQAQKEFTVNEALLRADLALHCTIEGEVVAPPSSPVAGQAWLVAAAPTGAFVGHAADIAGFTANGWRFITARTGLRVYDKTSLCFRHYTDSWQRCVAPATPVGGATIDQEVRTAFGNLLAKLVSARYTCDELSGTKSPAMHLGRDMREFSSPICKDAAHKRGFAATGSEFCPLAPRWLHR